jgi:hypothetical protein
MSSDNIENPDPESAEEKARTHSFLSADQIRQITDIAALWREIDDTTLHISHIRADLEFPKNVDQDGLVDPDWDKRAKGALAYGMAAQANLERQIRLLLNKGEGSVRRPPASVSDMTSRQLEALADQAALETARVELERNKIEREKIKLERYRVSVIDRRVKLEAQRLLDHKRIIAEREYILRRYDDHRLFASKAQETLPREQVDHIWDLVRQKKAERLEEDWPTFPDLPDFDAEMEPEEIAAIIEETP